MVTSHSLSPYLSLQGPFATFRVRQEHPSCEWTGVKFSSDGKKILISTTIGQLKLIDAFQGHEISTLQVSLWDTLVIVDRFLICNDHCRIEISLFFFSIGTCE